ncbi:hypothetical protein BC343_11820 [Mucilaginibacter pedocola]|uniref:Uncharacterized protein n=2 Tax=Mucilaginibacter pedocola TaxID=1792845 RepID=A0A1S9PBI5_9SPHI|nr:hypothetical protein BC343_11820 [Mucilaginibacter pedocola]
MNRNETKETYPFLWLDDLVERALNPDRSDLGLLSSDFFQAVSERLPVELDEISTTAKTQAFSLYNGEQLKAIAGHYDQAVRLLLQQAASNLDKYPAKGILRTTGQLIFSGLAGLAQNLERRYGTHAPAPAAQVRPFSLFKILLKLSGDQIGILVRGAFDAGLIDTVSKRAAFQALTPFLSTPHRDGLSHESLRSNSGRPERRDVDKVIEALGVLSKIVREYR